MNGRSAAGLAIRAGAIVALVALGLAIALIAWQERLTTEALQSAPDPTQIAALAGYLRIAMLLLLVGAAAVVLVALLVARNRQDRGEKTTVSEPVTLGSPGVSTGVEMAAGSALSIPLTRIGHLMSVGSLIRGFCHELNNELGPVQGYAELLCGDNKLSELHRRQIARIRDATKVALADIRSFGAALGWSDDPAQVTRLGDMAVEAARSAQAAVATKIELEVAPGAEVDVTATEADVGQAILHLCAAALPLIGRHEAPITITVDSIVGASSTPADDVPVNGHRLEIWSDPVDPQRTKVQFGALRPSWRYGRVRVGFGGHGWTRDLVGNMFDLARSEEAPAEVGAMALVGTLMIETGGVIMIDTCPGKRTMTTLLWPTRIAPEVGAPLELDAREDELDALVIHGSEETAEELSRRLTGFGLRVASTTSADAALDLVAEMGPKCHAIVLVQVNGSDVTARLQQAASKPRIFQFEAVPEAGGLERLASELRQTESST